MENPALVHYELLNPQIEMVTKLQDVDLGPFALRIETWPLGTVIP